MFEVFKEFYKVSCVNIMYILRWIFILIYLWRVFWVFVLRILCINVKSCMVGINVGDMDFVVSVKVFVRLEVEVLFRDL